MRSARLENSAIAAVSTAHGCAAVSIIRISGSATGKIINKIFSSKTFKNFKSLKGFSVHKGTIIDNKKEAIDNALLTVFKAPKSYTGEDTAEINCHGGITVTRAVLNRVFEAGARPAEPGEFTKRAVLNKKIDLTQAEAVLNIINAKTLKAVKLSSYNLNGKISLYIKDLRQKLTDILVLTETNIDFAEDLINLVDYKKLKKQLNTIAGKLQKAVLNSRLSLAMEKGVSVVFIGKPNTGKSSLLNALVKQERAIVTEVPGTTRDIIKQEINLKGIPLTLIDTAGIRQAREKIEEIGIEKTFQEAKTGGVLAAVFDLSKKITKDDKTVCEFVKNTPLPKIAVLNKTDIKKYDFKKNLKNNFDVIIETSCLKNTGIRRLETAIYSIVSGKFDFNLSEVYLTSLRQLENCRAAVRSIQNAVKAVDNGLTEEFIAADIREAAGYLSEITGDITTEDVLTSIFKNFCIGK